MFDIINTYYLYFKVVHIIAFVAWMAGLFYLPRLFVYHTEYPHSGNMLEIMERKLFRIIMQPAMHLTLTTGILMLFAAELWRMPWMHLKLLSALALVIYHFYLKYLMTQLRLKLSQKSSRFFRILNEVPTILLIIIVVMVIIQPF